MNILLGLSSAGCRGDGAQDLCNIYYGRVYCKKYKRNRHKILKKHEPWAGDLSLIQEKNRLCFEYVIPLLEKQYHLIIPALSGYDPDVLKQSSMATLWRTFDSCNNYKIPVHVPRIVTKIHYWYADGEEKERNPDIRWDDMQHEKLLVIHPGQWAEEIRACCRQ